VKRQVEKLVFYGLWEENAIIWRVSEYNFT